MSRYVVATTAVVLAGMAACTSRKLPPDGVPIAQRDGAIEGASPPPPAALAANAHDPAPVEVPIALSGRVSDATGKSVVGVRIDLGGAEEAVRYSGLDGAFTFPVHPGSYRLTLHGDCRISPSSEDLGAVRTDRRRDYKVTGEGCVTATPSDVTRDGAIFSLRRGSKLVALVYARIELCADKASGVAELRSIASEAPGGHDLTIGDLPALERQLVLGSWRQNAMPLPTTAIGLTTAIALEDRVLRLETHMPATADPATVAWVAGVARGATPEAIPTARTEYPYPPPAAGCR